MVRCDSCSNNEICGKKGSCECEHYNKSFTRSELIGMVKHADNTRKHTILEAVEHVYRLKLAI